LSILENETSDILPYYKKYPFRLRGGGAVRNENKFEVRAVERIRKSKFLNFCVYEN